MDLTGAGTAIMVAIAALLWFLYFLPTWMARREYLETERTATRLQQTLRIMAETAELPDQVRVEVTARDAARHERILRAQQLAEERRADVLAARAAASVRAATPAMPRTAASVSWSRDPLSASDSARLRRRRTHRLASVLIVSATAVIGVQLAFIVAGGIAPASWLVFAAGVALGIGGITVRRRVGGSRLSLSAEAPSAGAPSVAAAQPETASGGSTSSGWTPVPVPPPLYLAKPEAQPLVPTLDLVAQLRAEARAAEDAVRAAHAAPEVTPIRRPASTSAPVTPSRWAAMGRLAAAESADAAAPDLDEVLRRRRTAG
jgi:hypothetical protein